MPEGFLQKHDCCVHIPKYRYWFGKFKNRDFGNKEHSIILQESCIKKGINEKCQFGSKEYFISAYEIRLILMMKNIKISYMNYGKVTEKPT